MTKEDALSAIGITVVGEHDDLFDAVVLPEGWTKQATEHAMHSMILDEHGSERISVFYKAAFYDRRAYFALRTRYNVSMEPVNGWSDHGPNDGPLIAYVEDRRSGDWLFTTEPYPAKDYDLGDVREKEAHAWAKKHFPDYGNPLAYWDNE